MKAGKVSLAAALAGVLWTLAGCGGGGGGTPAPNVPPLAAPIPLQDGHQIGVTHWPSGDVGSGGLGQPVDGVACGPMNVAYHDHTHLSIFLNGQQLAVPLAIGITNAEIVHPAKWPDGFVSGTDNGCHYPLHTHDTSGKIHIEGAQSVRYTLGQFFALWGRTLAQTTVAEFSGMPIVVYIRDDGAPFRYTGDFRQIELLQHREITIQIGTPLSEIPTYDWLPGEGD